MAIAKTSDIAVFLNTATGSATQEWSRIRKQTELKLAYDAEVEENTYIDENSPTSEVQRYKVSFEGEHTAYVDDPVFKFLDNLRQTRAIGEEAVTDALIVYKYDVQNSDTTPTYAAELDKVAVTITEFGGEGGAKAHISYTLNMNGDPQKGTVTITDSKPTFKAA